MPRDLVGFPEIELPRVDAPVTDDVLRGLIAGLALISDPANWCQGNAGLSINGGIAPLEDCVSFCSWGALGKAVNYRSPIWQRCWEYLCAETGLPIRYNDTHSHAEVVAAWQRAISARRREMET